MRIDGYKLLQEDIFTRPNNSNVREKVRQNVREKTPILTKMERTVHRAVESLKKLNIIKRVGPDKGGSWKVKKKI